MNNVKKHWYIVDKRQDKVNDVIYAGTTRKCFGTFDGNLIIIEDHDGRQMGIPLCVLQENNDIHCIKL